MMRCAFLDIFHASTTCFDYATFVLPKKLLELLLYLCVSFARLYHFSPTLFLIVAKNTGLTHPFNFLTFGHPDTQSTLKCNHLTPLGLKGLRVG